MAEEVKFETDEIMVKIPVVRVADSDGRILEFKTNRVGYPERLDYFGLRNTNYGPPSGFGQPTFGEFVSLFFAARENERKGEEGLWKKGKTIALVGKDGLFVDDDPIIELVKGNPQNYENVLKGRLSTREENGVVYSQDGEVRLAYKEFPQGGQTGFCFSRNRAVVALVGNKGRADMLTDVSRLYRLNPCLGNKWIDKILEYNPRYPFRILVPFLSEFRSGLFGHRADGLRICFDDLSDKSYSMGVRRMRKKV